MLNIKQLSREWFREIVHFYQEGHQACVACRESHCVFFTTQDTIEEYRCFRCGYCVWKDPHSGSYLAAYEEVGKLDILTDREPTLLDQLEDHPILRHL